MLAVVADGMGGHLAGDVASRMAVAAMEEQWNRTETVPSLPSACEDWLKDRIHEANVKVHDHAKSNEECREWAPLLFAPYSPGSLSLWLISVTAGATCFKRGIHSAD